MTDVGWDGHYEAAFRRDLAQLIPYMRAFAHTFVGHGPRADDLCQESLLRAWANRKSFQPGSNLRAWLFTIVRNQYLTECRTSWRWASLDPQLAEQRLVAADNQAAVLELNDVRQALGALPVEQREALILTTAWGMSYDEAASVCHCPVGTIKSRVSRAKAALLDILEQGRFYRDGQPAADAMDAIMAQASALTVGG